MKKKLNSNIGLLFFLVIFTIREFRVYWKNVTSLMKSFRLNCIFNTWGSSKAKDNEINENRIT